MVQTKEEVLIRKRERAKNRKTEGICKDCGLAAEPNSDGTYKCRCWRCAKSIISLIMASIAKHQNRHV